VYWCGDTGIAAAAVLGQKGYEAVHGVEIGGTDHETPLLPARHQIGMRQFLQMKRQRGRWNRQRLADLAGGQAFRAGLNQQSKNAETGLLSERRQRGNNIFCFHNSIIIEIYLFVNYHSKKITEGGILDTYNPDAVEKPKQVSEKISFSANRFACIDSYSLKIESELHIEASQSGMVLRPLLTVALEDARQMALVLKNMAVFVV
jgi:hypothetical protein